ncbi:hypothetical protein QTS76_37180 [Micromonospora sp. b486]|nr:MULTISPECIES: hypothetical protein [unclassified Micromonospora]MDM4784678.1 hypothetical protein [Micromonospora sp. b486]
MRRGAAVPDVRVRVRQRPGARSRLGRPAAASRPFDRRRNGLVFGEGAGCSCWNAPRTPPRARAHRHADVLGWGAKTTPTTRPRRAPTAPGAAACMRMAVRDAGLVPGDIGYVNAHGTSTRAGTPPSWPRSPRCTTPARRR